MNMECAHMCLETTTHGDTFCRLCGRRQKTYHTIWCWSCFTRVPTVRGMIRCSRCKKDIPSELAFLKEASVWIQEKR